VPITEVRTHRFSAALHTPFITARRATTTVDSLLVEIVDDAGHRGFGEAPAIPRVTGETIAGAEAIVQGVFAPLLTGRDPDDLVVLIQETHRAVVGNPGAKAAVDVALHDLAARRLGIPLARLLGGRPGPVRTDVTLSVGSARELALAAARRVSDGFDVLKVKVGTDPAGDVARVRAVRNEVGSEIGIRLDANQGWTPREAVRVIRAIEDAGLGVELVEQPVPAHDVAGLAWVSDRVDTPILADEAVLGARDLVAVIQRRAADLVNIKLAKCGGLQAARALLELAAAHDIGVLIGSMMEGPVGIAAAASLAAAYPSPLVHDLDAAWWLAPPGPVVGGVRYDGGTLLLPQTAGLGITGLSNAED